MTAQRENNASKKENGKKPTRIGESRLKNKLIALATRRINYRSKSLSSSSNSAMTVRIRKSRPTIARM